MKGPKTQMNNQDEQNQKSSDPAATGDLELARAIRELGKELTPGRDLWPGIERNIADYPQKAGRSSTWNWMPYGVAASLLVAVVSLSVSLGILNGEAVGKSDVVSADTSLDQMAIDHVQVMNPLVTRFNQVNENLAPETLDDIYRNLEIMAAARRDLEAQVRKSPENRRLVEMLMSIHQQELDLLRQDFSPSGRY